MTIDRSRVPGSALSSHERALLELLCAGAGPSSRVLRAQVPTARWGGYEHEECECFTVLVDDAAVLAVGSVRAGGGPFASAAVFEDGAPQGGAGAYLGEVQLWLDRGRLGSVSFMPEGNDFSVFPEPGRHRIDLHR